MQNTKSLSLIDNIGDYLSLSVLTVMAENKHLATIIKRNFNKNGIHFFTPNDYSQQLAYMKHPTGKTIAPHIHNNVQREVSLTQEVLIIKKGKLRVDFYHENQQYLESHVLVAGDIILLIQGGHGFEVLEEIEMIEVKQGPYVGDKDKIRFGAVGENQIKIVGGIE